MFFSDFLWKSRCLRAQSSTSKRNSSLLCYFFSNRENTNCRVPPALQLVFCVFLFTFVAADFIAFFDDMPRKKRHLRASRERMRRVAASVKRRHGHAGNWGGVSPQSPWRSVAKEGERRKRKRPERYSPDSEPRVRARPLKRSLTEESFEEGERRKWRAIVLFQCERLEGASATEAAATVAKEFGISVSTLYEWKKQEGTLERRSGSGAASYDHSRINDFMVKKAQECGYAFTQRQMLRWVEDEFGVGSFHLVHKIFEEYKWTKVS